MANKRRLTKREVEVLEARMRYPTMRDVARELGIALPTVRNHLTTVRIKLGADNTMQAIVKYLERGDRSTD